jgi:hypothetical protein
VEDLKEKIYVSNDSEVTMKNVIAMDDNEFGEAVTSLMIEHNSIIAQLGAWANFIDMQPRKTESMEQRLSYLQTVLNCIHDTSRRAASGEFMLDLKDNK